MRHHRIVLYGGSIGGAAAWAHFAAEGFLSAAGLVVAAFALAVMIGLSLAALTEDHGPGSWSSVAATVRRVRNRRSKHDTCGVCARAVVNAGPLRVCSACDRIPVTLVR